MRRPPDIGLFVGQTLECKIVTIDQVRHNIIVSRRRLLEDRRGELKTKLLAEVTEGPADNVDFGWRRLRANKSELETTFLVNE